MKRNILKINILIVAIVFGLMLVGPMLVLAQGLEDMPIIEMTMTVNKGQVQPGEFLTYTIHYQNVGHWIAYDAELKQSLAKEVSLESTSFPMSGLKDRQIEFDLPDTMPGDGQTIFVKLRVDEEVEQGTVLISDAFLSYSDGRRTIDPLVYATARTTVGAAPEKLAEITAPVGSDALLVNLGLSLLIAGLVCYLVARLRRQQA